MAAAKDDPYSHPLDFVWRQESKHSAKIAGRKPSGWKDDPSFDEDQYFEAYRAKMILDAMWVGA
jgi:hypothetical protein